jgi:hypothetical protein
MKELVKVIMEAQAKKYELEYSLKGIPVFYDGNREIIIAERVFENLPPPKQKKKKNAHIVELVDSEEDDKPKAWGESEA